MPLTSADHTSKAHLNARVIQIAVEGLQNLVARDAVKLHRLYNELSEWIYLTLRLTYVVYCAFQVISILILLRNFSQIAFPKTPPRVLCCLSMTPMHLRDARTV